MMRLFLLATLALLLEHLLDDLLLLDQEGADDAVTHAVAASRATVGALDGLLGVADLSVLAGAQGGDLRGDNALDNWLVGIPRRQAERRPPTWRPTWSGTEEVGARREISRRARSPLNHSPKPGFPQSQSQHASVLESRLLAHTPHHIRGSGPEATYTRELAAAVTALGGSATLADVQSSELAAGGADNTGLVGRRVVAAGQGSANTISTFRHQFSRRKSAGTPGSRARADIRVAAAVGDSVVRHLGGVGD